MMQVNIKGRYTDQYGEFNLPSLCNFVQTDKEAVIWAAEQPNYFEKKHKFIVTELSVVEYNPYDGSERTICKLF